MKIAHYVSEGRIEEIDLGPVLYVLYGNYGIICHEPDIKSAPDGFHAVPCVSIMKAHEKIAEVFYHIYADAPVLKIVGKRSLTEESLQVALLVMQRWEFYSTVGCAYFPILKRRIE